MTALALEKLQVLVTGVSAAIARDVVRLLVEEGASVIAADRDPARLAQLDRDVGLYRARLETMAIDLANLDAAREWGERLRRIGRGPQLVVCCCGAPSAAGSKRIRHAAPARDVALGEHRVSGCPVAAAVKVLQPTLFLHAEPLRRTVFDRAISVLRHPTLRGLMDRAGRTADAGVSAAVPYARGPVREFRPTVGGEPLARLRLVSTSEPARNRADAA